MTDIVRDSTKKETLAIKPCPFCGGDITAGDCGYSSFNPGFAHCNGKCKRKWSLGYVNDSWEAGKLWNSIQPKAKRIEELEAELKQLKGASK